MPIIPKSIVYLFAKKYIAGPDLNDAIRVTKDLMAKNGSSTIDVLGEFVTSKDRALHEKDMSIEVLDAIQNHSLDTYLSVKPTSLGLGLDFDFGYENIKEIVDLAKIKDIFVRLDMENSPYTTATLELYKKLRENGDDNIGFAIQSYMRRSIEDVQSMIEYKPNIRLCKGIYNEAESIAYKGYEEIRENFRKLLDLMLDNDLYVGIATHDEALIQYSLSKILEKGLKREQYEFQMLLGVRENRRDELLNQGHRVRIYVPFGHDWYGYSTRRLKENPQMVGHIVKSIFGLNAN